MLLAPRKSRADSRECKGPSSTTSLFAPPHDQCGVAVLAAPPLAFVILALLVRQRAALDEVDLIYDRLRPLWIRRERNALEKQDAHDLGRMPVTQRHFEVRVIRIGLPQGPLILGLESHPFRFAFGAVGPHLAMPSLACKPSLVLYNPGQVLEEPRPVEMKDSPVGGGGGCDS